VGCRRSAAGSSAGIKIPAAARQLFVSRLLIAKLLEPHRERLNRLFDQMLDVIEDAFQARKIFLVKGVIVDGGPDHYARLEAVKMVALILFSRR
jgi:hypothetical protein